MDCRTAQAFPHASDGTIDASGFRAASRGSVEMSEPASATTAESASGVTGVTGDGGQPSARTTAAIDANIERFKVCLSCCRALNEVLPAALEALWQRGSNLNRR